MAQQEPKSKFMSFPCTGFLNEWLNPNDVGGSQLTDCDNLMYHRTGSWAKRPGISQIVLPAVGRDPPCSGFRWYRAFPTPLTTLVIFEGSHLLTGKDANNLIDRGHYDLVNPQQGPSFCAARDPQSNGGNGSDTLIIAGLILPTGSFGIGDITITGKPGPQPDPSANITVTVTNNGTNSVTTLQYQILGSDTPASIAEGLAQLLNQTAAFLNQGSFTPYIGESYFTVANPDQPFNAGPPDAICHLGALLGGPNGNLITYGITWSYSNYSADGATLAIDIGIGAAEVNVPHDGALHQTTFVQGGNPWSGLSRLDLLGGPSEVPIGLSYMAPNAFTGCVSWHQHVWVWGDSDNPDTLFACDINQPEAWTFMEENGGMQQNPQGQTGGYDVGVGDGDPAIQTCVPLGNVMYIFKTSNIYMISGYDFQEGEYQFNLSQQVVGYGIPSPNCVAVLENQMVFWSGRKFLRLAVGAFEPEHIGLPIPITEGLAAMGNQFLVQAIAGDFQVMTQMNNIYVETPKGSGEATIILKSQALFAMDLGSGKANTIIVFDDEMTELKGEYAWTKWSPPRAVGFWILYGQGPNPEGTNVDRPILWYISDDGSTLHQIGGNAFFDAAARNLGAIPWMAQTGWVDFKSAEILKNAHRVFLNANATLGQADAVPDGPTVPTGASFTAKLIPGRIIPPQPDQVLPYGTDPVTIDFNPTIAPDGAEALNDLEQLIETEMQSNSMLVRFEEDGSAQAGFELLSWGVDLNPEEAFAP